MRILTISNCEPLPHLGSGYVIKGFHDGLRALGHEVTLVRPEEYMVLNGLAPYAISYRQCIGMYLELRKHYPLSQYDIIEFWGGEASLATIAATRNRNRSYRVVQHTNGPEPRYHSFLQRLGSLQLSFHQRLYNKHLVHKTFSRPDAVVTVSRADSDWLAENQLPQSGNRLPIEIPMAECMNGRPIAPRSEKLLGFCGTWLEKKGIHILIPAVNKLLSEFPEWRFLILGTNGAPEILQAFPESIRARIEIGPFLHSKEALAKQYERIDIFLLPSLLESFGISVAEAMACGCAPITTPVGFGAALKDGVEALILNDYEEDTLVRATRRLIQDPILREKVAAAARLRVQDLTWPKASRILSDYYESLLKLKPIG